MVVLGFLNTINAHTPEARDAPSDYLECPLQPVLAKAVIVFHDETTFQSNNDQPTFWETKGTHNMWPKGKAAGIMVSNFIGERNG